MSKLKRLISQLNDQEVRHIHKNLIETDANKSADLLHLFREGKLEDSKVKEVLNVNNNAYYTLRSRLNEKIETFILEKSENPRTELLKQVASIKDLIYTKNRIIALASLHKLEKDLSAHNLHSELAEVYRAFKKLHIHDKKYVQYSQLYNQQIALVQATSEAEDLSVSYFKFFGEFLLENSEINTLKLSTALSSLKKASENQSSKRIQLLYLCASSFHDAYFKTKDSETILLNIDKAKDIIDTYLNDSLYYQLDIVFEYHICLLYYFDKNPLLKKQATIFNKKITKNHIGFYYNTYPCFILNIFNELDINPSKLPDSKHAQENILMESSQTAYQLAQLIKNNKEREGTALVEDFLSTKNLKQLDKVYLDYKLITLCLQWNQGEIKDIEANIKSLQRLIRNQGKKEVEHTAAVLKLLTSITSKIDLTKKNHKIDQANKDLDEVEFPTFSPMAMVGKLFFKNLKNH